MIIKPQLGIAVAVVLLARREWKIVGGAIVAALAQWGLAIICFGLGPMRSYVDMLGTGAKLTVLLEPKPYQLHSLRAFWSMLIPNPAMSVALYGISSAAVLMLTARTWRTSIPLAIRYSALLLATALVSPHLGVYDLVVLAPAYLLTADSAEKQAAMGRRRFRAILYAACVVPLAGPLASITHVQLSVPVFSVWLAALYLAAARCKDASAEAARLAEGAT